MESRSIRGVQLPRGLLVHKSDKSEWIIMANIIWYVMLSYFIINPFSLASARTELDKDASPHVAMWSSGTFISVTDMMELSGLKSSLNRPLGSATVRYRMLDFD